MAGSRAVQPQAQTLLYPIKHRSEDSAAGFSFLICAARRSEYEPVLVVVLRVLMVLEAGATGADVTMLIFVIVLMTIRTETIVFLSKTLTKRQVV